MCRMATGIRKSGGGGRWRVRCGGNSSLCFVFLLIIGSSSVQGFFIDLEALGFATSKSDDAPAPTVGLYDEPSSKGSEQASILIAAPSEQEKTYEVESKADPNKSVKLTLAELKQLVLGTVKDLTPSSPPINIKIVGNRGRVSSSGSSTTSTTTAKPFKINKFRYKDEPFLKSLEKVKEVDAHAGEGLDGYWERPPSVHSSVVLPPYAEDDNDDYGQTNEVDINIGMYDKPKKEEKKWMQAAKAVFKGPSRVVNTFSRWRSGGKGKQTKRTRPVHDMAYQNSEPRRRRKRPPPRGRRPGGNNRSRSRLGQRRRGHFPQQQRLPSYYDDEYGRETDYKGGQYSSGFERSGSSQWERIDHLYDSTRPNDDMPQEMGPPQPFRH